MTEYNGPARSPLDEDRVLTLLKQAIDRILDKSMPRSSALALRRSIVDLMNYVEELQRSNPDVTTKLSAEIIRASYTIGALAAVPQQIRQIENDQQKKRGQKSGEGRAERAKQGWMAHARELAIAIRQEKPSIAREALAMEIALTWKDGTSEPKSIRRMVTVLADMEQKGLIPAAQHIGVKEA